MKLELESPTAQNQFFAGDFPHADELTENADARVDEMLKAGIRAAQEGNRTEARLFLLRVTDQQPENETAWLWLASISEYPEELLGFLANVLRVNPENERALDWAKATKELMAKTLVQRGIAASREDKKEFARQCFEQALSHDDRNEMAWLWLASVTETAEEKKSHLEKVLSINPENETAQASLQSVNRQTAQTLLKKSNGAAISGDHEAARKMLEELMQIAPEMEEAWILKAYLSTSHEEKLECFEQVLTHNPENETARAGIDSLNALKQRELEIAAQRAHFENLQPVEEPANEVFENNSCEVVEEVEEYAAAEESKNFSEPQNDFVKNVNQFTAEEIKINEDSSDDSPTQELDEQYLNILKDETGFSFESEETTAPDYYFGETEAAESPVEFSESVEVEVGGEEERTVEYSEERQHLSTAVTKEFEIFPPDETVEEEQDAYEIVSDEQIFSDFEEDIHSTHTPNHSEEVSVETENYPFIAVNSYSEDFVQKPAAEVFEIEAEEAVTEVSFEETVQPAFEDYNFSAAAEDDFQPVETAQSFSGESQDTFEMPQEAFAASSVEFSESETDFPTAEEEIAYEIQIDETDSVENYFSLEPEEIAEQPVEETPFAENAAAEEVNFAPVDEHDATARPVHFQAEPFPCPFCNILNEPQAFACHSCRSVLTLSDLEMMLANAEANQDLLELAVRELETEKQLRELGADEITTLGMAHLNLKNLRQGFSYLQEAVQLNPNNVVLASQVHALAIRLAEIEEQESRAPEAKTFTIMVVDDSPTVRKLISGKLEKCGHTVLIAVDGMDALAKINEVTPDLILLDITMPKLDGYQVCKLIRNNASTRDVPVVMISGRDGFFDKVRGRMAGSTGYITKPFGPDTLMKTIEAYLN